MLFLVALFLLKTNPFSKNFGSNKTGLTVYNSQSATIASLVSKDTDGDGIPDWEENLWGTDPTKKETTSGIPDSVAIENLKIAQGKVDQSVGNSSNANLTQTDKFSRELFSTVTTLSQGGVMDQATVDKISSSLANNIQNSAPKKVYEPSDINVVKDDSLATIKNYSKTLDSIRLKYPIKGNVMSILQEFIVDENTVDESQLLKLSPIIEQMGGILDETSKMKVPESLASLHLQSLNALEKVKENLNDIQLFGSDPIVALSAISQYEDSVTQFGIIGDKLNKAIE